MSCSKAARGTGDGFAEESMGSADDTSVTETGEESGKKTGKARLNGLLPKLDGPLP
jgi:hypothetical protein